MSSRKLSQSIGEFPFSKEEMISNLEEFARLYEHRPIKDNFGGQAAAQLFYSWFVAKKLQPSFIIESGVYKGQGTWAFEQACPNAQLVCLDPYPQYENGYKSDSAIYIHNDFTQINWDDIDKVDTLCFFDDHQDSVQRLMYVGNQGFRRVMFEDNYPPTQGDCLSLKKVFESPGEEFRLDPNFTAKDLLFSSIKVYCEMPPIYDLDQNRWGENWLTAGMNYPLLTDKTLDFSMTFLEGMNQYTWINYVELKDTIPSLDLQGK